MLVEPKNLEGLIESEIVRTVSKIICERINSTIFPIYNDILFEATKNQYEKSEVPIGELFALLISDREKFENYVCASILASRGVVEQEFPRSEKPDDEETAVIVKQLGLAKDFVVSHLIDYWFLAQRPSGFEGYLRATRTPNAKKQAKKLIRLLESVGAQGK